MPEPIMSFTNRLASALLCAVLLGARLVCGAEPATTNVVNIQEHTDGEPSSYTVYHFEVPAAKGQEWAHGHAFGVANIEWEVIQRTGNPTPKKFIYVIGGGSFSANTQIHKAIMKKIFSRWPVSDFDDIEFVGALGGGPDWSWNIPIAAASSKSADYQDFKTNYPHSKVTSPFELYHQFVSESRAYDPLRNAFRDFGADLEFLGGEKEVLNSRAQDLPFYPQLRAMGIKGKTRVIYDAIGNGFTIKPLPSGSAAGR